MQCTDCDKRLRTSRLFRRHVHKEHGPVTNICGECKEPFLHTKSLEYHIRDTGHNENVSETKAEDEIDHAIMKVSGQKTQNRGLIKRSLVKTVTPSDSNFRPESINQLETFLRNAINSGTLVQFVDSESMTTNDASNPYKSLQNQSYAMCHLDSIEGSECAERRKNINSVNTSHFNTLGTFATANIIDIPAPIANLFAMKEISQDDNHITMRKRQDELQALMGKSPILSIEQFQNWGKNQSTLLLSVYPETKTDIANIIKAVNKTEGATLRCAGETHSWAPLFSDAGQVLMYVSKIQSDYQNGAKIRIDNQTNEVSVMTGVTTADFKKFQLDNKVNINCNVLLDAVQIVSVVASGCHGVGWDAKTPGDYVTKMRIFNSFGELVEYTNKNRELMRALSANFGLFGVIYDITLQLDPEHIVSTETAYIPMEKVFLNPNDMKELVEHNWSVEIFWFPFNSKHVLHKYNMIKDEVWVRKINKMDPAANVTLKGEAYYSAHNTSDLLSTKSHAASQNLYHSVPSLTPLLCSAGFSVLKDLVYPAGIIHQELVRAIHFRNYIHRMCVRDMEFAFDLTKDSQGNIDYARVCDIIKVVTDVTQAKYEADKYPFNITLEMRFMAYSDSFMNPASIGNPENGGSGHVFFIEVLSLSNTDGFEDFCIDIAGKWLKMGGTPHLAKDWKFIPGIIDHIKQKMGPGIQKFKEQLTKANVDQNGIFRNESLNSLFEMKKRG